MWKEREGWRGKELGLWKQPAGAGMWEEWVGRLEVLEMWDLGREMTKDDFEDIFPYVLRLTAYTDPSQPTLWNFSKDIFF